MTVRAVAHSLLGRVAELDLLGAALDEAVLRANGLPARLVQAADGEE